MLLMSRIEWQPPNWQKKHPDELVPRIELLGIFVGIMLGNNVFKLMSVKKLLDQLGIEI